MSDKKEIKKEDLQNVNGGQGGMEPPESLKIWFKPAEDGNGQIEPQTEDIDGD